MHKNNEPITNPPFTETSGIPDHAAWQAEVGDLLARAADICVEHGLDVDTFMRGAWTAYVDSRPGLRDYIEEMQLRSQLDELRKLGRMGEA